MSCAGTACVPVFIPIYMHQYLIVCVCDCACVCVCVCVSFCFTQDWNSMVEKEREAFG
jgi:hypothetical protein